MASVRHIGLFPFCVGSYPPKAELLDGSVVTTETGEFTAYPFKLPVRLCTRMWWTVKHWRFSFQYYHKLDLSPPYDPGTFEETSVTNFVFETDDPLFNSTQFFADYVTASNTEKDLVCWKNTLASNIPFRGGGLTKYITSTLSGSLFGQPVNQEIERPVSLVFATDAVDEIEDRVTIFPPYVQTSPKSNELWVNLFVQISTAGGALSTSGQNSGLESDGSFQLLKEERDLRLRLVDQDNFNAENIVTVSNLVMEPKEFWEYDPGDGKGPIYDKTTGETLR